MTERRKSDVVAKGEEHGGSGEQGGASPTGLTYREQQRRRIVIAGLTAPTLMSLPSRRAWSAGCSKSKLKLSGNASAKKQVLLNCPPIACKKDFWKNNPSKWPLIGAVSPSTRFIDVFDVAQYDMFQNASCTLMQALSGANIKTENSDGSDGIWNGRHNELKELNKHATAAFLNAYFLNNMGFILGYTMPGQIDLIEPDRTSAGRVKYLYESCVANAWYATSDDIAKGYLNAMKSDCTGANEGLACPIE